MNNNEILYELGRKIPEPISSVVEMMETPVEKRMAMYATATITGALMPHVWFNYDNKVNHLGLMLVISFPPASGKGKIAHLPNLLRQIVKEQSSANSKAMKEYKIQMRAFDRAIKKGEKAEMPEKPRTPVLLIPANTTSAKLTEQLYQNRADMMALIFESETDAITNMMGNKFGLDNSMIFRKAFHNEPISLMRKTNDEHIEAANPKMAIVLSGTPSQLPKLFHSNQDGLVSRFMIVSGEAPVIWKDVNPCETCVPLDVKFEPLAKEFYQVYQFFKSRKVEVKLTEFQWACLNNTGRIWIMECSSQGGENAVSLAKRHANMIVRLAAIFTMLRCYSQGNCPEIVYCSDDDYNNAEWLIEQSFHNSLELYKKLPGEQIEGKQQLIELYEALPMEFLTREMAPLTQTLQKSQRTLERMLSKLLEMKWVEQIKKGKYRKLEVADLSPLTENDF